MNKKEKDISLKDIIKSFKEIQKIIEKNSIADSKRFKEWEEKHDREYKEWEKKHDRKYQEWEKKHDREHQDWLKKSDKMDAKLDRLARMYGGMGDNLGNQAEEFFYQGFKKNPFLNKIHFDEIDRNVSCKGKEYDIVLYNKDSIGIVSVKHRPHKNDIFSFIKEDIPVFKSFFTQFKDYKFYAALAGLSIPSNVQKTAEKEGLFLLTQSGENPKIINSKNFKAKWF